MGVALPRDESLIVSARFLEAEEMDSDDAELFRRRLERVRRNPCR
jgi:hypothetical protein